MFLRSLSLTNFRSYRGVELPLSAKRVLICGRNGAGKSSVKEAIRYALTGRSVVTDGRGSGADLLMPTGESSVKVGLDVDEVGDVLRARIAGTNELHLSGVIGDLTTQQDALLLKINTSLPYLEAVLSTEQFLSLHHAEAKTLVLELLNVTIPYDNKSMTLDQIELRYQNAMEDRKAAKQSQRMMKVPEKPVPAPGLPSPLPSLDSIDALATKIRAELETRMSGVGVSEGKRQVLQSRLEKMRVPKAHEDVSALKSSLLALEEQIEAESERNPAPVSETNTAERLHFLRGRIEALQAHAPTKGCVLDPSVPCGTSKQKFNGKVREYQTEIDGMPPLPESPLPASKLTLMKRESDDLLGRIRAAEATIRENAERLVECEALEAELSSLAIVSPEQKADIDALRARLERGAELRKGAEAYWSALSRHEDAVARKQEVDEKVERLEKLCTELGPKGIRLKALDAAIGTFTGKINAFTEPFGWTVSFEMDPWKVLINGRPSQAYSESEQFRIGIAIQLAIAELSGLSFAVIDRLDMLDIQNRALATKMIFACSVDQVIILATREPEQALPALGDTIVHRIDNQNGHTVVVESVGV